MSKTAKRPSATTTAEDTGAQQPAGGLGLLMAWNASLAEFYARRVQKYWQYPLDLAELRSLEDVAKSLLEFERELIADYADQADEFQRIARGEPRRTNAAAIEPYEAVILKAQADAGEILAQAKAQAERILASATRATTGDAETARKRATG